MLVQLLRLVVAGVRYVSYVLRLELVDLSLNCNTLKLMITYQFSTIAH